MNRPAGKALQLFSALASLTVVLCVSIFITSYKAATPTALDQYEIGEYETDPLESEKTEEQYEAAKPWRDPGHISREEIRFSRALRALDTVPRDSTWDTPDLWSKYDQVMQDPTMVRPGWTNPRTLTRGADPLQRAVERHAYGAEGHREPERGWSMDDDEDKDVNSLLENEHGDDTPAAAARRRAELGRLIDAVRRVAGTAGYVQYPGAPPRRVDGDHAGLRARRGDETEEIVREMRGLRQDLRGLSGAVRDSATRPAHPPTSGQQLAASAAEVRALERKDRGLEADDAAQKRRLARLEAAIRSLRRRRRAAPAPAPAAPAAPAPLARRRRMSDVEAARDISDYFDRLGAQTAADTAAHVQAELAQLRALGVAGAAAAGAAPQAAKAQQQSLAELIKGL